MRCRHHIPFFLIVAFLILVQTADAIPAFARRYNMSCSSCHSPFPKLKPLGEQFMNNAYQLPGMEPAHSYKETGDDKLLLMDEVPIAIRLEGYGTMEKGVSGQSDFQAPFIAKLLSGGQIAKDVSYYFYFLMTEGGTIVGPEDAFLIFRDVLKSSIDITVGQFQASDPLFKRELRLTREDYEIYNTPVGNSSAKLTYDRGVVLSYRLPSETDVAFQVLNGNGIGGPGEKGFLDNDNNKNFMLRLSQRLGDQFRVGFFGYSGKEQQSGSSNSTLMFGPDLTLNLSSFQINAQYVHRGDNNPFFEPHREKVKVDGAFVEAIYSPNGDKSDWYGVVLFNWINSKSPGVNYRSATLNGNYMMARNLRLVGEYTYDLERDLHRVSVGFVSSF